MKKNLALSPLEFTSSFLSCQNDLETILKKLFIESEPYSTELKKLLVINTKDCLDRNNIIYQNAIKDMSLARLKEQGYIRLVPKIQFEQHSEVKSYLLFSFDNFHPNRNNPMFRDCNVFIEAICNTECWALGNFRSRPIKICGYVDAILNNAKLSGIGTFQFESCSEIILDSNLAGYSLAYSAIHGSDDLLPSQHDWIEKHE